MGCDSTGIVREFETIGFQFTHPVWGATAESVNTVNTNLTFQFTHPVWGATTRHGEHSTRRSVSIHAPRVGCDTKSKTMNSTQEVSIHAPRVGCDLEGNYNDNTNNKFQFTHPVWGATDNCPDLLRDLTSFNSRTPCGVRLPRKVG